MTGAAVRVVVLTGAGAVKVLTGACTFLTGAVALLTGAAVAVKGLARTGVVGASVVVTAVR